MICSTSVDARNYLPPSVGAVYGIHGVSPVDCYEGSGPFNSTTFTSCRTEGRCVKLTVVTLGSVMDQLQLNCLPWNYELCCVVEINLLKCSPKVPYSIY